jgi:predicted O-linked N-acetylglucosamine transferase (SPINDLY family)
MTPIDALLQRAVALHAEGSAAEAAPLYRQILASHPDHADALHLLGVAETQLGRPAQGIELINRSLLRVPGNPVAIANLGNAQLALSRAEEALATYDDALRLQPDYTLAWFGRANALAALARPLESLAGVERVLALAPEFAEAWNTRAGVLLRLGRTNEALRCFDEALRLAPAMPKAHAGRGHALAELGQTDAAVQAYEHALALDPRLPDVLLSLGISLSARARFDEAVPYFRRLREIDPDSPYAPGASLHAQLQVCDWTGYAAAVRDVVAAVERDGRADFPFSFLAVADAPALQRRCAEAFSASFRLRPAPLWTGESYRHERIRVAYVSADFLEHPTSYLLAGVFERHDRTQVEPIAVSLREDAASPTARRVRAAFERVIVAGGRSDADVARQLREAEVDIAVDLMGYTGEHRANIFAYRPAPVQVSYLGMPATLGAPDMDYLLADDFLIPPGSDVHYSEQIVYLPDSFQGNDDRRPTASAASSRADAGLPAAGFVWCSFHSIYKLNPPLFDLWCRLLRATPASILWLVARDASVEANLRREAAARGVEPERLRFAPSLPYPAHLARIALADLCLDTLPFNGGATTSDALWAGVPVITCAGRSFAARMSGSLLRAVGLPELITESLTDYEALAIELSRSPARLAALRATLAQARRGAALFDTERFCRHLESAFQGMVERSRRGEQPASFKVCR